MQLKNSNAKWIELKETIEARYLIQHINLKQLSKSLFKALRRKIRRQRKKEKENCAIKEKTKIWVKWHLKPFKMHAKERKINFTLKRLKEKKQSAKQMRKTRKR